MIKWLEIIRRYSMDIGTVLVKKTLIVLLRICETFLQFDKQNGKFKIIVDWPFKNVSWQILYMKFCDLRCTVNVNPDCSKLLSLFSTAAAFVILVSFLHQLSLHVVVWSVTPMTLNFKASPPMNKSQCDSLAPNFWACYHERQSFFSKWIHSNDNGTGEDLRIQAQT